MHLISKEINNFQLKSYNKTTIIKRRNVMVVLNTVYLTLIKKTKELLDTILHVKGEAIYFINFFSTLNFHG